MVVRVDDAAERFPGGGFGGGLEGLGVDRRAQRVDGEETGRPGIMPALLRLALSTSGPLACVYA